MGTAEKKPWRSGRPTSARMGFAVCSAPTTSAAIGSMGTSRNANAVESLSFLPLPQLALAGQDRMPRIQFAV